MALVSSPVIGLLSNPVTGLESSPVMGLLSNPVMGLESSPVTGLSSPIASHSTIVTWPLLVGDPVGDLPFCPPLASADTIGLRSPLIPEGLLTALVPAHRVGLPLEEELTDGWDRDMCLRMGVRIREETNGVTLDLVAELGVLRSPSCGGEGIGEKFRLWDILERGMALTGDLE